MKIVFHLIVPSSFLDTCQNTIYAIYCFAAKLPNNADSLCPSITCPKSSWYMFLCNSEALVCKNTYLIKTFMFFLNLIKLIIYFICAKYIGARQSYPPGHCRLLQSSFLVAEPGQWPPTGTGGIQSHLRLHSCDPGPHVVLQLPQRSHSPQLPLTTTKKGFIFECLSLC